MREGGRYGLRHGDQAILRGAEAHGFDTELWTLPRIAEVIWRLTGVSYHPLARAVAAARPRLEPTTRARSATGRGDDAIAGWRADHRPRVKTGTDPPRMELLCRRIRRRPGPPCGVAAARPLAERALAIRERVLGPDHPDTATARANLEILRRELE